MKAKKKIRETVYISDSQIAGLREMCEEAATNPQIRSVLEYGTGCLKDVPQLLDAYSALVAENEELKEEYKELYDEHDRICGVSSDIDTLESRVESLIAERDALKAENDSLYDEWEKWNNAYCDKCPLSTWSFDDESCEEVCGSKAKMIAWLASECNRAGTLTKAIAGIRKTAYGNCDFCVNKEKDATTNPCKQRFMHRSGICQAECEHWQLDIDRFVTDGNEAAE